MTAPEGIPPSVIGAGTNPGVNVQVKKGRQIPQVLGYDPGFVSMVTDWVECDLAHRITTGVPHAHFVRGPSGRHLTVPPAAREA